MTKQKTFEKYVMLFNEWREAGVKVPSSRDKAIPVIEKELKSVGANIDRSLIRKTLAKDIEDEGGNQISNHLLFIYWDLTENSGMALDYSLESNYFAGLLEQARKIFSAYTRVAITVGKTTISIPTMVSVPGRGVRPLRTVSKVDLTAIIDRELAQIELQMRRWKFIGANITQVKSALTRLNNSVLAEFDDDIDMAA